MKTQIKIQLVLLLIIGLYVPVKGQIGIGNGDSILIIQQPDYVCCNAGPGTGPQHHYSQNNYFIHGDSTIQGNVYKKLFFYSTGSNGSVLPINPGLFVLNSLLRSDSGNIYRKVDSVETLIINYNLSVGDSFLFGGQTIKFKLLSIDSSNINGTYHPRYNFEKGIKWVKGLGDVVYGCSYINSYSFVYPNPKYLTNPFGDGFWATYYSSLKCYSENGTHYIGTQCYLPGAIGFQNIEEPDNSLLYPNPIISNKFNLTTSENITSFALYDFFGRLYKILWYKTDIGYELQLPSDINSGMYFLNMRKAGELLTKKIVVDAAN